MAIFARFHYDSSDSLKITWTKRKSSIALINTPMQYIEIFIAVKIDIFQMKLWGNFFFFFFFFFFFAHT